MRAGPERELNRLSGISSLTGSPRVARADNRLLLHGLVAAALVLFANNALIALAAQTLSDQNGAPATHLDGEAPLASSPSAIAGNTCEGQQAHSAELIARRDYSTAARVLQQALPLCSNHRAVLLALAKAQMLSRQLDAALISLKTLLAADPADAEALMVQGEVLYLDNRSSEAQVALQNAIAAAPADVEPHYLLGRLYYSQSNVKGAMTEFQKALTLDPAAFKVYDGLGLCYENEGDVKLAAQSYLKGIELVYKDHPAYDTIYADFAEFMLRYGHNQRAFDLAAEAAGRNPREPRNFYLAGKALYEAGHLEQSVTWLRKAAEMDHFYPDPHYLLARAYHKLGEGDQAAREIETFKVLSKKTADPAR
jgi:Flp pilus assembly protein TadD